MKTLKWFFTTNEDGENPALILLSMMAGLLAAAGLVWLLGGEVF